MKRTAWVWLVGAAVWLADGLLRIAKGQSAHAVLALTLAAMFALAWGFYRRQ